MSSYIPETPFEPSEVQERAEGPQAVCMNNKDRTLSSPAQMEEVVRTEYWHN